MYMSRLRHTPPDRGCAVTEVKAEVTEMNFPFHARERQPLESLLLVEKNDQASDRQDVNEA